MHLIVSESQMRTRQKREAKDLNGCENDGAEIKCSSNHGLESTGAPPAAGTPETHP